MLDYLLLAGRLLLVALLYLFLFAVMRTGIGMVKGQYKKSTVWNLTVEKGPKTLRGIKLNVNGPLIVGRSPGCDILIASSYVSGRHARFSLMGSDLMIEDLNSTNGTLLNGSPIHDISPVSPGDIVSVGNVDIKIGRS